MSSSTSIAGLWSFSLGRFNDELPTLLPALEGDVHDQVDSLVPDRLGVVNGRVESHVIGRTHVNQFSESPPVEAVFGSGLYANTWVKSDDRRRATRCLKRSCNTINIISVLACKLETSKCITNIIRRVLTKQTRTRNSLSCCGACRAALTALRCCFKAAIRLGESPEPGSRLLAISRGHTPNQPLHHEYQTQTQ